MKLKIKIECSHESQINSIKEQLDWYWYYEYGIFDITIKDTTIIVDNISEDLVKEIKEKYKYPIYVSKWVEYEMC